MTGQTTRPSTNWADKLSTMEQWYRDFLINREEAFSALEREYAPHVDFLSSLSGDVLDVGGGSGPTARYLQSGCNYVVVDPSSVWSTPEWQSFSQAFRRNDVSLEHVVGVGENLPFPARSFDAVLSMWSLNHAEDWRHCIREMARVAKPGASVLLVLEDMEPSWPDILRLAWHKLRLRAGLQTTEVHFHNDKIGPGLKPNIRHKIKGGPWPIQDDHIAIDERDAMREADASLKLVRRDWKDGFLTIHLRKAD